MKIVQRHELNDEDRILYTLIPKVGDETSPPIEKNQSDLVVAVEPHDYQHWFIVGDDSFAEVFFT